ncbi:MAG: hypothetical protein UU39_C0027G0003 [Candidatus Woesebacteria bacterium GW2011_GWD1_41_12]|uniref:Uncharacterized protein n=1 Tax=Candidatus Woesebacteria bacterium GW2011_GWD1_41_12 TaxID=1618593 RepID=A0A0G0ULS3_9BACT|nr:MAG: hypothetical protein UU39_C0027G0003 [Candidatus Woesebacteria bacterium GW2011_GWD1_41_12]
MGFVILTAALTAVSFVGLNKFASLREIEIENEARFQCAESSRYQVTGADNVIVWYPVSDLYSKCLQEKGIK